MPTIDMEVVQELLDLCEDGDTSLVQELIEIFLTDGPARVEQVRAGAASGDLDAVERAAHSLKGSSGNLGAQALMESAEALQNAARAGEVDRVAVLAPELVDQFAAAAVALRELLVKYEAP